MNPPGIVHPEWLDYLDSFFTSTCSIQSRADTPDGIGGVSSSWSNVTGLTAIHCCVGMAGKGEVQAGDRLITYGLVEIVLQGHYTTITTAHRCVVGSTNYNILNVGHGVGNAYTSLTCQVASG
jgi:head-tail adaptor